MQNLSKLEAALWEAADQRRQLQTHRRRVQPAGAGADLPAPRLQPFPGGEG